MKNLTPMLLVLILMRNVILNLKVRLRQMFMTIIIMEVGGLMTEIKEKKMGPINKITQYVLVADRHGPWVY